MDFRGLTVVTAVMLSWGCATTTPPPPPPATATRTSGGPSAAPLDDLLDETVASDGANARTDAPGCRALLLDFARTLAPALKCEHNEECTLTVDCMSARADFKSTLEQKVAALGPCVRTSEPRSCPGLLATCYEKRCTVGGRVKVD